MFPVGFEPTISAGEWPQTNALDRADTGTGRQWGLTDLFEILLEYDEIRQYNIELCV